MSSLKIRTFCLQNKNLMIEHQLRTAAVQPRKNLNPFPNFKALILPSADNESSQLPAYEIFDNSFISLTLTCHFLHDKGLLLGWHCLIGLARKKLAEPFHQQHLSGTHVSFQGSLPTSLVADHK